VKGNTSSREVISIWARRHLTPGARTWRISLRRSAGSLGFFVSLVLNLDMRLLEGFKLPTLPPWLEVWTCSQEDEIIWQKRANLEPTALQTLHGEKGPKPRPWCRWLLPRRP